MRSRAFSLLELLVALGLVAVIAGLALPAMWGRLEGARLDTASRQVAAAVIACRAEAQRAGEPLELRVVRVGGPERKGSQALVIGEVGSAAAEQGREESARAGTVVPWAMLPEGVRASPRKPVKDGPRRGEGPREREPAGVELDESSWRVGVFLPDGGVVTSGPVYLQAGSQTTQLTLNRWTGGSTAEPIPDEDPEEES